MKILIIKLSSIGDVVHTLPSLYALRQGYPDARIDWLVEEGPSGIIKDHPLLNRVIVVKRRGWLYSPRGCWEVARGLRNNKYDIVLDFQGLFKSGIWVFLSGGKRRIGFDRTRDFSYLFLNERLPPYDPDRHAVDRYLDMVRYLGLRVDGIGFPALFDERERDKVLGLLRENGILEGEDFIVVSPLARWKTKQWGMEGFASFCKEVSVRFGCKVVLVGGAMGEAKPIMLATEDGLEGPSYNKWAVVNLAGRTTLKELACLLSLSRLMVTVDSGPMHIAAAVGTPVVALFGPTAPWRTGPYGEGHKVIRKGLPCSPCFLRRCSDLRCMKEITVEEVVGAVADLLDGRFKLRDVSDRIKT